MINFGTVFGTVRFVGLLTVYVAALTAIGVARGVRALYRRMIGRRVDAPRDGPTADEPSGESLSGPHATINADGGEELTRP